MFIIWLDRFMMIYRLQCVSNEKYSVVWFLFSFKEISIFWVTQQELNKVYNVICQIWSLTCPTWRINFFSLIFLVWIPIWKSIFWIIKIVTVINKTWELSLMSRTMMLSHKMIHWKPKYREEFLRSCLDFQNNIGEKDNDEVTALLVEKELLENEVHSLNNRNTALQNSTAAFVEEVLEDLHNSIYGTLLLPKSSYYFSFHL